MSEVEKAREDLVNIWGVGPCTCAHEETLDALIAAVRAEAIASTEAKFKELAEKWRKEAEYFPDGEPNATIGQFCNDLDSLLTTRHDAGEKSKP